MGGEQSYRTDGEAVAPHPGEAGNALTTMAKPTCLRQGAALTTWAVYDTDGGAAQV